LISTSKEQHSQGYLTALDYRSIREFVFTSSEIGDPGDLLVKANRQMRNLCKKHNGPFVASLSKGAKIYFRKEDEKG